MTTNGLRAGNRVRVGRGERIAWAALVLVIGVIAFLAGRWTAPGPGQEEKPPAPFVYEKF